MLKTSIAFLALVLSPLAIAGGDPYPTAECLGQLRSDARLRLLDGKVVLGAPFEAASIPAGAKRVATLQESAVLGVWSELRQECFALGGAHRAAAHPDLPALADRQFAAQQRLLADLREGRLGFAEFEARRLELWDLERRRQAQLFRQDRLHEASAAQR